MIGIISAPNIRYLSIACYSSTHVISFVAISINSFMISATFKVLKDSARIGIKSMFSDTFTIANTLNGHSQLCLMTFVVSSQRSYAPPVLIHKNVSLDSISQSRIDLASPSRFPTNKSKAFLFACHWWFNFVKKTLFFATIPTYVLIFVATAMSVHNFNTPWLITTIAAWFELQTWNSWNGAANFSNGFNGSVCSNF